MTPRPIAWISTRSKNGVDNLAPYSFFTVASCDPPVLLYTQVTQRTMLDKDTLRNLKETGECVVNIVSTDLVEKMNRTSASLSYETSEFEFAGLERVVSDKVKPFSVKASPIRYECTLRELISLGDQPTGGTIVMLDVRSVYVRSDLLNAGQIDQERVQTVGKMGGDGYSVNSEYIKLQRP